MPPPSQHERRDATRAALVGAARPLFGERGFHDVPAEQIVAAAGVTRGALHHHFGDKRGLFRAVFEELEAEIASELASFLADGDGDGDGHGDGRGQLLARALSAFLDICRRPEVSRIALTDAPAVLGWKAWREIEFRHGLGLLASVLDDGRVRTDGAAPELVAQLVLGSVIEAALVVAHADDPEAALAQVQASLTEVFGALLT